MSTWLTGYCDTGVTNIHYLRSGGTKPPMILLHGLTANGACWSPLARTLEADFDVVMPDARGHGRSSTPPHGYAYDDHANDVVVLIRRLGLVAPIILGHSMGGMTAALVAQQMGERIGGVILADPTFLSPRRQREVHDSDVVEQHRRRLNLNKAELVAELRIRHPRRSSEILALLAEARLQTRTNAFDVLTPPIPEYHRLVRAIRAPILIVVGDTSVVSIETARKLQHVNANVRVEQIQNAGHGLPYDQPDRFAAVIRPFITTVASS